MEVKNTLSSIVDNLIKLQRNNAEILSRLSDVINSEADTVELKIEDISNDTIKSVSIPSLGSIKKDIERIDENIKQLSGLSGTDASVRLQDGTFRTVAKTSLKKPAADISNIEVPTSFENKNNWFFESFLNPYLYVTYNFGNQINPDTKEVKSQRFILNLDTDSKQSIFNEEFKNNSTIDYNDFIDTITSAGIQYALDEDVVRLPPKESRFYGNFSVLRVFEENETVDVNGVEATKKNLKFQLDKLTYNDKNSNLLETQQLKIGDSLLVNKNNRNTRYYITNIDFETTTVTVYLAEGYDSVSIGANNLSYYSTTPIVPQVQIGVGFNENIVQFIKPIDPESNEPSDNWTPGVGFFSSELTINDNGVVKTLETYYQENVVDFGAHLLSIANENIPPSSKGLVPNTVTFSATENPQELKVVQINKHVTDVQSNKEIESLNREKNSLKSQINQLDESIKKLRNEISTKTYKTDVERQTDKNKLAGLIEERASTETLYQTTVNDIITKANDKNTSAADAKYRIRGFFDIPAEQTALDGSTQDIIQFQVEYRYLTRGGSANNLEEFKRTAADGKELKGVYSNWVPAKTPLRQRLYDATTGGYYWAPQNTEDGEAVNINQIDIPIQPNESVEIRIKSISEAGYPSNPLESDYSDIVRIDFPEDLGVSKDILSIVKEASDEQVNIKLQQDLVSKGIDQHISDQFTQNDTFYAHQAFNLASGYLTAERNVISLYDKIAQMQAEIDDLRAQVEKTLGILVIKIEDDLGNQQIVQQNTLVSLFAGNYKDIVSDLDKPKGVIVSKNYFLRIENSAATAIELWTVEGGSKLLRATSSSYATPAIGLSNPLQEDLLNTLGPNGTAVNLPYQSQQVKGQYIYVRDFDVTGTKAIYETSAAVGDTAVPSNPTGSYNSFLPSNVAGATIDNYVNDNEYFIWDGTDTTDNVTSPGSGNIPGLRPTDVSTIDSVYVHAEHPVLQAGLSGVTAINEFIQRYSSVSKYAPLDKELNPDTYYKQSPVYMDNTTKFTNKISFQDDDKYLVGSKSCGCYMYLAPQSYENIRVDGNDGQSTLSLEKGTENGKAIQIVYQFRMTDYFGPGTDGIGRIGGKPGVTQVLYSKILGFDIFYDEQKFSFDLEITSRYKSNSVSTSDIPTITYQNTANQLGNTVSQINPTITE